MPNIPAKKLNGSARALAEAIQGLFEEVNAKQGSAFAELLEQLPTKDDLAETEGRLEARIDKLSGDVSTLRGNTQVQFADVHKAIGEIKASQSQQ